MTAELSNCFKQFVDISVKGNWWYLDIIEYAATYALNINLQSVKCILLPFWKVINFLIFFVHTVFVFVQTVLFLSQCHHTAPMFILCVRFTFVFIDNKLVNKRISVFVIHYYSISIPALLFSTYGIYSTGLVYCLQ